MQIETVAELAEAIADLAGVYGEPRIKFTRLMEERIYDAVDNTQMLRNRTPLPRTYSVRIPKPPTGSTNSTIPH